MARSFYWILANPAEEWNRHNGCVCVPFPFRADTWPYIYIDFWIIFLKPIHLGSFVRTDIALFHVSRTGRQYSCYVRWLCVRFDLARLISPPTWKLISNSACRFVRATQSRDWIRSNCVWRQSGIKSSLLCEHYAKLVEIQCHGIHTRLVAAIDVVYASFLCNFLTVSAYTPKHQTSMWRTSNQMKKCSDNKWQHMLHSAISGCYGRTTEIVYALLVPASCGALHAQYCTHTHSIGMKLNALARGAGFIRIQFSIYSRNTS